MAATGPGYHIPFPRNFLSLNTPVRKSSGSTSAIAAPEVGSFSHGFLSNRPAARRSSDSSDTSSGSALSPPSSPAAKAVTETVVEHKVPSFLALNSKYARPPTTATDFKVDSSGFLSNRH
jgi:hypothetical protein